MKSLRYTLLAALLAVAGITGARAQLAATSATNNGTTATVVNKLAIQGGSNTLTVATTSSATGIVGLVIGGAGTSGSPTVVQNGVGYCAFDGTPTAAGDYVQYSTSSGGECHDAGSTEPNVAGVDIVGRVWNTTSVGGNYPVNMSITPAAPGGTATSITPGTTTVVGATAPCLIENSTSTTSACPGVGTGVVTAFGNALSGNGGLTTTIASGTAALGTGAISSATCATLVTATATNTATTDVLLASFNGDPHAVTGYIPSTSGMLTIITYPTANTANFLVCNNTASSITPGAITLNWRVVR